MEDSDARFLIEDRVGLLLSHRVLARSVARVQHRDAALCALLRLFLALFNFKVVDELVKFVEAVVLLVNNHLILEHVLVVSDPVHGHGQLFARQRRELARVQSFRPLVAEGETTLLIWSLL